MSWVRLCLDILFLKREIFLLFLFDISRFISHKINKSLLCRLLMFSRELLSVSIKLVMLPDGGLYIQTTIMGFM